MKKIITHRHTHRTVINTTNKPMIVKHKMFLGQPVTLQEEQVMTVLMPNEVFKEFNDGTCRVEPYPYKK